MPNILRSTWMRSSLAAALLLFPCVTSAQSIVTVPIQHCLYHFGDDQAWAAPALDESTWRPFQQWRSTPVQPHLWVRCHADVQSLKLLSHAGIQISLYSPYQLYLNGAYLGGTGNLHSGNYSLNSIRTFPIPDPQQLGSATLVALRITDRSVFGNSGNIRTLTSTPLAVQMGDDSLLKGFRATQVLVRASGYLRTVTCYLIVGILAIPLLALYFFDRSRTPLLLLSISCISLSELRINEFATASLAGYSLSSCLLLILLGNMGLTFAEIPFFYSLAQKRIPLGVWILLVVTGILYLPYLFGAVWGVNMPVWLLPLSGFYSRLFTFIVHVFISALPFAIFWPYRAIPNRMRIIAGLCLCWGLVDLIWFLVELTGLPVPGIPNLFARWGITLLDARGIATACVLSALLVLLFREQRQITQDRALLAGELRAATEIQRMLAPAKLECVPGFRIDVAFHPMREIGGDFYLCRVLPDGKQRLLLGDVSGKGSAAAMTAAMLLGGATARDADSPAKLLAHLNEVLLQTGVGGFATCLCADLAPNGQVTLANAGHLAPYLAGEELSVPAGLPLGVVRNAPEYEPFTFTIPAGHSLTLISDGVVEARNPSGELFGFDRTRAISTLSADQIASSAAAFGQDDDITVLELTRIAAQPQTQAISAGSEAALNPVKS